MSLQLHLLTRIIGIAMLCLLTSMLYSVNHSHQLSQQRSQLLAESLIRQLQLQLVGFNTASDYPHNFPDFELWKQTNLLTGVCISISFSYSNGNRSHSICNGNKSYPGLPPSFFSNIYKGFYPETHLLYPINYHKQTLGNLEISTNIDQETDTAWQNIVTLTQHTAITVCAVCLFVYFTIRRSLKPAQTITQGLNAVTNSSLQFRLPNFKIKEWRLIAEAFNQQADKQQKLLLERQKLALQLMSIQEQERRNLAQELHDEFGQCLVAINALASSIKFTAKQQCPSLVEEAQQISQISSQCLQTLPELLNRLRPAEFDQFGLAASLNTLINNWNKYCAGKTDYRLQIIGDCQVLPAVLAFNVFRIVQECLTNISKHAKASLATIDLMIDQYQLELMVKDNGKAVALPFAENTGIGLLGIRERVAGLNGKFALSIGQPSGLIVSVQLPLTLMAQCL